MLLLLAGAKSKPSFVFVGQSTLVPARVVGSGTPTFTRATIQSMTDFEGVMRQVPAGCAVVNGARYVRNLIAGNSQNLTNSSWTLSGSASRFANDAIAPDGTLTATRITTTAAVEGVHNSATGGTGYTSINSVWLKGSAGGEVVRIGDGANPYDVTITSAWRRYAGSAHTVGSTFPIIRSAGAAITFWAWGVQLENVTGQANQNPSEYVSIGVLSAPYQGAGIDGVKYFTTLNGNTVASNVVTEATGAHIDSSQSAAAGGVTAGVVDAVGPLGYLSELLSINSELQSNAFTTTPWVALNCTPTQDVLSPSGAINAWTITADGAGYARMTGTALTKTASTPMDISVYAKKGTLSWIMLTLYDPITAIGHRAWFDVNNGVVGSLVAIGVGYASVTSRITACSNGFYRCDFSGVSSSDTTCTPYIFADTANAAIGTPSAGQVIYIYEAQIEKDKLFRSSTIPTTTVAVTRNATVLSYPSAGNLLAASGSITQEVTWTHAQSGTSYIFGSYVDASNYTALFHDGTNAVMRLRVGGTNYDATLAMNYTAFVTAKLGGSWGAGGVNVYANGVKGTPNSYTGPAQLGSTFQIGVDGNSLQNPGAMLRNTNLYVKQLSDSAMIARTT